MGGGDEVDTTKIDLDIKSRKKICEVIFNFEPFWISILSG